MDNIGRRTSYLLWRLRDDDWLGRNFLRGFDNVRGDERRRHGGRGKGDGMMRCGRGRSYDKGSGDCGEEYDLLGCGCLRVFDKRVNGERFGDC